MRLWYLCVIFLASSVTLAQGQAGRRVAIVTSGGHFGGPEGLLTDSLTTEMVGKPGVAIIDRAAIDRIIKEQNFQNSDRASADTASRIGKLAGASAMVIVTVNNADYSTKAEKNGGTTTSTGTVVLSASARLIDVETGVILAQPKSDFQQSEVIATVTQSPGYAIGVIRVPAKQNVKGSDPKVVQATLSGKAYDSVAADLARQLLVSIGQAPSSASVAAGTAAADLPLVAGIANGSVFINQGSSAGIKTGERFQVTRSASVGLKDPKTGKDIMQKKKICVFVAENVDESNSSGSCQGGTPQSGDLAEPIH